MIQASNDLILGIELNEEYAQLTYFHPSVKEPLTLSFETDAENYLLPVAMRKAAGGKWELWDGTGEAAAKVTDLYRKLQTEDEIETGAERVLAAAFRPLTSGGNNSTLRRYHPPACAPGH